MYGQYAPHDNTEGGVGQTTFDTEKLFSTSRSQFDSRLESQRKDTNTSMLKPVRWNTGAKSKQDSQQQPVRLASTTKKLFQNSPTKDDLNDSFIEDPDKKLLETPVHISHRPAPAGSGFPRQDTGFTEDMSQNNNTTSSGGDSNRTAGSQDSRLEDSSLIRAFMPLSMNQDVSDLSINSRSRARSTSRERNTMDSGSFTAETNQDMYRMYPVNIPSSVQKYRPQVQMIQQPHTDVKPKYKPVRRPRNPPEARKALEDKENNDKTGSGGGVTGDLVLGKLGLYDKHSKDDVHSLNKEIGHQDLTHPSIGPNHNHQESVIHPSGFNPVTHQPEYKHSSLRQQSSSKLHSAPSLTRPQILDSECKDKRDEIKQALEDLDMYKPATTGKDTTAPAIPDTTSKQDLELKTPQTQKQLPSYIQNILKKGFTKPSLASGSSTKHEAVRSRYNSANTNDTTKHESTFPYAKSLLGTSEKTGEFKGSGKYEHSGSGLLRSRLEENSTGHLPEPTYPSGGGGLERHGGARGLPEILEQSGENQSKLQLNPDHSIQQQSFHSNVTHEPTYPYPSASKGARTKYSPETNDKLLKAKMFDSNDQERPNLKNKAVESSLHHSIMKSKSASHVEERQQRELEPRQKTGAQDDFQPAPAVRQVSPDQEPRRAGVNNLQANHSSKQQQQHEQQQICDDRTPRPVEQPGSLLAAAGSLPKDVGGTGASSSMPPPPPVLQQQQPKSENILVINNRRYKILKVLGKGGSSKVYEAVDEEKANVVAIKQVDLSHTDEAQAAGCVNEINMLAKLQSEDRIVRLYDYENDKKREILYVVMEKGDTDLALLLKNYAQHKEITPAMVKHYWTEMLHAVHVIHKRGIIHSDLKPANFLLVAGRLKLIDFGIASSVQSDMTSVMKDTQMGTFNFMSPEAIQDLSGPRTDESGQRKPLIKISYKSDVWSLGCILYNLAYGKMPFGDIKIPVMKLQAILNPDHKIPFPPDNVDPQLLDVIKSCLTRDVKLRPSIEQLLQHSYVTGMPASPPPSSSSSGVGQDLMRSHMLAKLETNLEGVLSPGTFQKMKAALKDPNIAKKLDM